MGQSSRLLFSTVLALVVCASLAVAQPSAPPASGKYWVFIGTATSKALDGSKGIYRCELDVKTGQLSEPKLVAEVGSPSFLAISPNGKCLYAVGETPADGTSKKEGSVFAYQIDAKTGDLTKLNSLTTGGDGPCHVSVNRTGQFVLEANYNSGSSALFKVNADGSLEKRTDFRQHEGNSVNKSRQAGPHAHCTMFQTSGGKEFAYVVDLGLDKVFSYQLDESKGELIPTNPAFVKVPDGSGPRHIAFNVPAGKAYVCGEMSSTLITLRRYGDGGVLEMYGTNGLGERKDAVVSTLPQDTSKEVRQRNSTAEVLVHPDGGHVLVSNRGHDSIAVFKVNADSTTPTGHIASAGDREIRTPRNFNIDPTGKWVLIASLDGGTVRVAQWDGESGKLTDSKAIVKKPMCIKFLAKPE
jgi:6-phosphogluconolactonase